MKSSETHTSDSYPRDLIGYGSRPPHPRWPHNARIAVSIVLNYEEGGEHCVLHGDAHSESVLTDVGVEHRGQGEYLSPVELTVAALANCASSMLAVVAEHNGVDISAMQLTASFEMSSGLARRIGSVQLAFKLPGAALMTPISHC